MIVLLVLIIILLGYVFVSKQKQVGQNENVLNQFKEFKTNAISFLYNPKTEVAISQIANDTYFIVAIIGETNKEKGISIKYRANLTSEENNKVPTCPIQEISGKNFYVCYADGTTSSTDNWFIYKDVKKSKEIRIGFSAQDKNALIDNRYIDLGSLKIF